MNKDTANAESKKLLTDSTCGERSTDREYPSKAKQIAIVTVILGLIFVTACIDSILFPFFPTVAAHIGLSNTEIGVVFSAYDFSKFLASPVCGSLLVKWHPKSMCAVGNAVTALTCFGFAMTPLLKGSVAFLLVSLLIRIISGVSSAMIVVAGTSLLMKSTSFEPSTIADVIETAVGFGYVIGPSLGGGLYEVIGYAGLFLLIGGLMLAVTPLYMKIIPKIVEDESREMKGFLSLMAIPGCLIVFIHCVIIKINEAARSTGLEEFIVPTFDTTPSVVSLLFAFWAIVYVISCAAITKLLDKRYVFYIMLFGWCLITASVLLIGPSPLLNLIFHGKTYFWLLIAAQAVTCTIGPILYIPSFQAALGQAEVNGYAQDSLHTYGMISGLFNSGMCLGSTIGPVISGVITDALDFPWAQTYLCSTHMVMITLIAGFLCYMKINNKPLYPSADTDDVTHTDTRADNKPEKNIHEALADKYNKHLENFKFIEVYEQPEILE